MQGSTTETLHGVHVLIETLWNVNFVEKLSISLEPFGFNRNIVECKQERAAAEEEAFGSFNRNIVECKCVSFEVGKNYDGGFNRNIVECKFYSESASGKQLMQF